MNKSEADQNPTLPVEPPRAADTTLSRDPAVDDTADFSFGSTRPQSARAEPERTATFDNDAFAATHAASSPRSIPGYEILKELGRGAMGVVYAARQIRAERIVALKLMLHGEHADARSIQRFAIEAQAAARLQHPNIVQVYEVGEFGGAPFFTLEYVNGGTLASKIARNLLPHDQVARLMCTLAVASEYAHSKGVVHRDLKPANIMLDEHDVPKIADFGLARRVEDDSHLTRDGTIVGTPSYMAPEQASGDLSEVGPRSDVYALGAILYELVTGRPPFKGATVWEVLQQVRSDDPVAPSQLQPGVPIDLETICLKCLQKDPDRRYQSSQLLADDIQRFIDNQPILARPIGQVERLVRLCKRNPREAMLTGAIALLLLTMAITASIAAIRINSARAEIASQKDEISREKDISDDRLTLYRNTVSTFVNRLPRLLEDAPLPSDTKVGIARTLDEILVDSGDTNQVGSSNFWGRFGSKLRQAEAIFSEAYTTNGDAAAQAEELASEALEIAKQAAKEEVDAAKAASNLSIVLSRYAVYQFANHPEKLKEIVAQFREALQYAQDACDASEADRQKLLEYQAKLAERQYGYAKFLMQVRPNDPNYQQKSIEYLTKAAHTQDSLLSEKDLPTVVLENVRHDRARLAFVLAKVYRLQNQIKETNRAYEEAVELLDTLVKDNPYRPSFLKSQAIVCATYGEYLVLSKAEPDSIDKYYTKSQEAFKQLLRSPDVVTLEQSGMAINEYALGLNARRTGREQQAVQHFQLASAIRERAYRESLIESELSEKSLTKLLNWAICQARLGSVAETTDSARQLVSAAQQKELNLSQEARRDFLVNAAACMGILSDSQLQKDPALSKKQFDQAFRILELAIDAGYKDTDYLRNDPDFEWLASKPDALAKILDRIQSVDKAAQSRN